MRRLIPALLVLVLLALVGYKAWQVSVLRKQVAALQVEVAALRADRAKEHVLKGDFDHARKELEKSLQSLQQAGRHAGSAFTETLKALQCTLRDTRAAVERLGQNPAKKPNKVEGG
ncbi:MAG TPA: hypothetical protein VMX94_05930 [Armatimonadota bacterium]|nr:hypothetical protein [Armatimonadota bacterium]